MKRALDDYLRSMRISSEVSHPKPKLISSPNFKVKIVEIDSEEVEPFMTDNKASNMFKDRFTEPLFRTIGCKTENRRLFGPANLKSERFESGALS